MPNKTLSLAMVIFISLLAGASSFAVVLFPPENAKEEPKQEVARQPEQKTSPTVQAEKKTEPESETPSRQQTRRRFH